MEEALATIRKRWNQMRGEKLIQALTKRGFNAVYFAGKEEAKDYMLEAIPETASVGIGGSVTLRELNLVNQLKASGRRVYDHWEEGLTREEIGSVRKKQLVSDVFISSTNAITMEGQLINTDGSGNRVAAMIFGPQKIMIVVGMNKIVKDIPEGLARIKKIAPLNFIRGNEMNYKNQPINAPCVHDGLCKSCSPASGYCVVTTILEGAPKASPDYHVIVIGESLGY